MPTNSERQLIASLEDQAALINRFLDRLAADMARASSAAERAATQKEIDYQLRELARVHRARDDIQRALAKSEGKRKRGGDA